MLWGLVGFPNSLRTPSQSYLNHLNVENAWKGITSDFTICSCWQLLSWSHCFLELQGCEACCNYQSRTWQGKQSGSPSWEKKLCAMVYPWCKGYGHPIIVGNPRVGHCKFLHKFLLMEVWSSPNLLGILWLPFPQRTPQSGKWWTTWICTTVRFPPVAQLR